MITYIFKNKAFFDYWLDIKIFIELLFTLNENFKSSSLISPPLYISYIDVILIIFEIVEILSFV